MKYFYNQPNSDIAINQWNNSQFDLIDIVLSLTDNHIRIGAKIYAVFCRPEVLNLMKYFECDFSKIKQELGIVGNYVKRRGNIYSKHYNPERCNNAITLSTKEMKYLANIVYKDIMEDLAMIAKIKLNRLRANE